MVYQPPMNGYQPPTPDSTQQQQMQWGNGQWFQTGSPLPLPPPYVFYVMPQHRQQQMSYTHPVYPPMPPPQQHWHGYTTPPPRWAPVTWWNLRSKISYEILRVSGYEEDLSRCLAGTFSGYRSPRGFNKDEWNQAIASLAVNYPRLDEAKPEHAKLLEGMWRSFQKTRQDDEQKRDLRELQEANAEGDGKQSEAPRPPPSPSPSFVGGGPKDPPGNNGVQSGSPQEKGGHVQQKIVIAHGTNTRLLCRRLGRPASER